MNKSKYSISVFHTMLFFSLLFFFAYVKEAQGNQLAYEKGVRYYSKQDFASAEKWFLIAAEQGHPGAQFRLGYSSLKGLGVQKDPTTAIKWLLMAAEQGAEKGSRKAKSISDAQYILGLIYRQGDGVPQNYPEAARWFRLALETNSDNIHAAGNLRAVEGIIARKELEVTEKERESPRPRTNDDAPSFGEFLKALAVVTGAVGAYKSLQGDNLSEDIGNPQENQKDYEKYRSCYIKVQDRIAHCSKLHNSPAYCSNDRHNSCTRRLSLVMNTTYSYCDPITLHYDEDKEDLINWVCLEN